MDNRPRYRLNHFVVRFSEIWKIAAYPSSNDGSLRLVSADVEGENPPHAFLEQTRRRMRKRVEAFRDRWLDPHCWPDSKRNSADDCSRTAEALSPHAGSGFRDFFDDLLGYPRFADATNGRIQPGGIPFIGVLKPPSGKIPPKTLSAFNRSDGSFDPAIDLFRRFVHESGSLYNCKPAALEAVSRLDKLVEWLKTCQSLTGPDLDDLESRCNALKDAMQALCVQVASYTQPAESDDKDDTHPSSTLDYIRGKVDFIASDVQERKDRNSKRGKANRAGSDENPDHPTSAQRATLTTDMNRALVRIHNKVKDGMSIIAACRSVCRNFYTTGGKKDALGKTPTAPLKNQKGVEMTTETQFQTMARYYRERYNT